MPNSPSQPKSSPASRSGLKEGQSAGPPAGDPKDAGPKRPIEEEDTFGGAERAHKHSVSSDKAKP